MARDARTGADSGEPAHDRRFQRLDLRASKQFGLGGARRLELIGQVFNLFGTDSFGIGATPWQMNATSNAFGTINTVYPRQQAELAVRFLF